ncbi:hypothetical protein B0H17DRAFT_1184881 [Mycena rosella]|uniref:Uncharacterized protein n=1 Tax=Mycena rosella TaxID=1033263 RepID=A0AAD7CU33_MYCRO|nr:hypothetical protein B0H17DRAFT_1184881 [Mycena rosella]
MPLAAALELSDGTPLFSLLQAAPPVVRYRSVDPMPLDPNNSEAVTASHCRDTVEVRHFVEQLLVGVLGGQIQGPVTAANSLRRFPLVLLTSGAAHTILPPQTHWRQRQRSLLVPQFTLHLPAGFPGSALFTQDSFGPATHLSPRPRSAPPAPSGGRSSSSRRRGLPPQHERKTRGGLEAREGADATLAPRVHRRALAPHFRLFIERHARVPRRRGLPQERRMSGRDARSPEDHRTCSTAFYDPEIRSGGEFLYEKYHCPIINPSSFLATTLARNAVPCRLPRDCIVATEAPTLYPPVIPQCPIPKLRTMPALVEGRSLPLLNGSTYLVTPRTVVKFSVRYFKFRVPRKGFVTRVLPFRSSNRQMFACQFNQMI